MENIEELAKKLGRLPSADERDKRFLISDMKLEAPVDREYRNWYANGWWGDQQLTSQCVGYSWAHWAEDGPVTHKGTAPIVPPQEIYTEAQKRDEWEGEGYDGTSVRAGAKYLQEKGLIQEYRWAWDLDTLVNAVLSAGPVVVGTNWYYQMFFPDAKGVLKVSGSVAGGHAYLVDGVNKKTGYFRIKNSWGRGWGKKGFGYISFSDMSRLISEDGEVCLALEKKL